MSNSKIGIVIPTLNEEKSIGKVIGELKRELNEFDFVIVVVDGKSSDGTVSIAKKDGAQVIFQRNMGYGEALFAGYFYALKELDCEIVVTIDGDGTYSAKDCARIIKKIESFDADYVVGRRKVDSKSMSLSHRFGNWSISWSIRNFLNVKLMDTQSGLYGFRTYLIDNIDLRQSGWAVNTELLTKASELGMIIDEIDISYSKRIGTTNLTTIKAGMVNFQMIIRMIRDFKPLLLLGTIGTILFIFGIISGIFVLYDYYVTGSVNRPNLAVLAALFIMTGIQLFSLGLVADMIRRKQKRLKFSHNLYTKDKKHF